MMLKKLTPRKKAEALAFLDELNIDYDKIYPSGKVRLRSGKMIHVKKLMRQVQEANKQIQEVEDQIANEEIIYKLHPAQI